MFSHVFWKNTVWLRRFKWRSACKYEAHHTKLFCTQDNNESLFENFDPLAVSGGKAENLNESNESEFAYFADEQLKLSEESTQPTHRKTSVKQMLAYTNKVLYGPLLETSAQRKRNIEITEDETGVSQKTKKRKKSKKNKPVMTLQPLVSRPENAHHFGEFPGDELKSVDKFHYQRVKIKHQHETGSFSDSKNFRPGNKILIFKKSSKDSIKYDNIVFNDIPKIQKIYVSSWNQGKDQCDNDNASGISETISGDILSNSNAVQDKSPESTYLASCPSNVKTENNQEIEQLESFREKSFLLSVDNSKFTSVPSIIDCEMIESFPLEKTESPGKVSTTAMNKDEENILTIGMFDGGYHRLPSVSTILEATMPENQRRILERWKAKMIKELGEEGFEEYRKGLFEKGKLLHGCIQSELTGISPSVENMPTVQGFWTSISHVLPKISSVSVLESRLVHPYLYYQGAVDCVAAYKGMPVLIDWKTSTKPKLTLKAMYDNPLQVVAYLGALNYDNSYQFSHQVQSAMLVVAYDTGLPAHVHIIDKDKCQAYWKVWCARLVQFWRQLEIRESL
ncbi:uncharacterized protein LOC123517496 [Portunus trituberculatus]|uniref:uncharacterized protein LOC123517496 n=1 Tax=Portunus trituberculatus TaxID=210409 RepID=UPI001E1CF73F|nr:uncharacterized protein LOC123517496 [Portunus trituberculatus]XP_045133549.1 uncharacterized protein LOC123517496 [Portunus trituberculatus]XP_045133550.1 uncharacterized protein LOC123517496 [Portunus trituberculatus]XP_045133551.1 uncharacterized protein LOC123517496 [Portunus trituberculatus]